MTHPTTYYKQNAKYLPHLEINSSLEIKLLFGDKPPAPAPATTPEYVRHFWGPLPLPPPALHASP